MRASRLTICVNLAAVGVATACAHAPATPAHNGASTVTPPSAEQAATAGNGWLGAGLRDVRCSDDLWLELREIIAGGPAARAGLEPGDRVVIFDRETIEDSCQLVHLVRSRHPGERVVVIVERAGRLLRLPVTLGVAPAGVTIEGYRNGGPCDEQEAKRDPHSVRCFFDPWAPGCWQGDKELLAQRAATGQAALGAELGDLTTVTGTRTVVVEVEPDGDARDVLEPGDALLFLDGEEVASFRQLLSRIEGHTPGDWVTFVVRRGNQLLTRTLPLGPSRAWLRGTMKVVPVR